MFHYMKTQAEQLFPGYFAMVMSTGALSLASFFLGFIWIAKALFYVNVLTYLWLSLLTVVRVLYYFPYVVKDITSHQNGPGFFTLVAGTSVLGSQWYTINGYSTVVFTLWWTAFLLWFLIMYTFFFAVTIRKNKPGIAEGINGAWLIATVATQSLAVLGVFVSLEVSNGKEVYVFISLCMYLLGCMLYLNIMALIFYRFTFVEFRYEALTPPYWINMGAVAITALAGSLLLLNAEDLPLLSDFIPFLHGFTLFFWMTGTWWIPLLFLLMIWKHRANHQPLRYEPQLWGMAFPLAMYTLSTFQLSKALEVDFLMIIPNVMIFVALTVWVATFVGLIRLVTPTLMKM